MIERARQKRFDLAAQMNVVPYIDVTLVLLIIFMVTAPLLHQGVHVDLPRTTAEALPEQNDLPMIVTVTALGEFFLNISESPEKAVHPEALAYRLAAEVQRAPDRKVFVRGDQSAPYGTVMSAMVLLQKAGVPSVGLITDQEERA